MNMFGLTLGSYNRLEEVYKFVFQTKNTITLASESAVTSIKKETYIEDLKKAVEDAKAFSQSKSDLSHSDMGQIDFE
jgi:hypothetical protein